MSEESIRKILRKSARKRDIFILGDLLKTVRRNHEFETLFSAVLALLAENNQDSEYDNSCRRCFVPASTILNALRDEFFATLSPLSAYEYATKLGVLIHKFGTSEKTLSFAATSALLNCLICATPLMSATRLRDWIRGEFLNIFRHILTSSNACTRESSASHWCVDLWKGGVAQLIIAVYAVLAMELSYGDALINNNDKITYLVVWRQFTEVKDMKSFSAAFSICEFLLATAVGDARSAVKSFKRLTCAEFFCTSGFVDNNKSFEGDERFIEHLSYDYVLNELLMWNLSALSTGISTEDQLSTVIKFLVARCWKFSRFDEFLSLYVSLIDLRYSKRGIMLQKILFECLRDKMSGNFIVDEHSSYFAQQSTSSIAQHIPTDDSALLNGKTADISRKRKLKETIGHDVMDGVEEGSSFTAFVVSVEAFDGYTLVLHQSTNSTADNINSTSKADSCDLPKIVLRRSDNAPNATDARKQLKSLKKLCQKVCQLFTASSSDDHRGTKIIRMREYDNFGATQEKKENATLNRRENALNALLKLSAAIASCKLPRNVLTSILDTVKPHQLSEMKKTLFADGALSEKVHANAAELLYVLRYFMLSRSADMQLELDDAHVVALLMADGNNARTTVDIRLRSNALKLIASVLRLHRTGLTNFQVAPIFALCLAFCRPISSFLQLRASGAVSEKNNDKNYDCKDGITADNNEKNTATTVLSCNSTTNVNTLHAFALAELAFLANAVTKFSTLASSQSGAVLGILPDFFHLLRIYRAHNWHGKADKLEQKLSALCTAFKRNAKSFHKKIPLVMSSWLAAESSHLSQPMYQLFSACENGDLALLSTNLRLREKRAFALLQKEFYRLNKIIG